MEGARILCSTAALELLDQTFTRLLADPECADLPLFVAVDTESSKGRLCEVGISIFDPYCLLLPKANDLDSLNDLITTYCYAKGGSKDRRRYKVFRLGTVQPLKNANVQQIFDTHLRPNKDSDGDLRQVILIGHSIVSDLCFLKRHLSLDLSRISNIEAILDTQNLSRPILMTSQRPSLKKVLDYFELTYIGLHNAAHDSRYTMRALLMLFVKFKQSNELYQSEQMMSVTVLMESIARCHKVNERRTWTISAKVKPIKVPALFDEDCDEDEDEIGGMLGLLA